MSFRLLPYIYEIGNFRYCMVFFALQYGNAEETKICCDNEYRTGLYIFLR